MRILVVVSDFPKVTETFAVANILHYLSKGHEVDLFHIKPFRTEEVVHAEAEPAVARAFTFPWFGGPSFGALLWAARARPGALFAVFRSMIWAFRSEPRRLLASLALVPKTLAAGRRASREGVQHVNAEFASHPGTTAWIIHRVFGIPFSFSGHMHDIFVSQSLLATKSQDAEFVRTISRYNVNKLSNLPGFAADKIVLVRCGVDLDRFKAPSPVFPEPGSPFEILFVGGLHARKGCHLLLEALATLDAPIPWHLTIVGGGPEEDRLRNLAAKLPPDRVTFRGPQPSEEVLRMMSQANLVTAPSMEGKGGRSEGIPVVTMEALALRRPLISSRLSGIPELVEDGVTGLLIEPGDVEGLKDSIRWTMENYQAACELGAAGRKRVESEYDIRENAAALLALIEASQT